MALFFINLSKQHFEACERIYHANHSYYFFLAITVRKHEDKVVDKVINIDKNYYFWTQNMKAINNHTAKLIQSH